MNDKYGTPWSREELILALYLYCQIPFRRTKANQPEVIRLASLLGRTPSSVARKLGNFGAFDPVLASSGVSGLTHTSRADRNIWEEFENAWDNLVIESGRILEVLDQNAVLLPIEEPFSHHQGPTERDVTSTVRLVQGFFRNAVLASYTSTCCVCDIDISCLLVACHIVPWATREELRADPQNGLCLCSLHERAFDRGLLTIVESGLIQISETAKRSNSNLVRSALIAFDGQPFRAPHRFAPRAEYLQWHSTSVFQ
jgi:putative restriction endonuclease